MYSKMIVLYVCVYMGFPGGTSGTSRQEYWSVLSFPSPGDLPDPEIKPGSPALQADSLPSELRGKIGRLNAV